MMDECQRRAVASSSQIPAPFDQPADIVDRQQLKNVLAYFVVWNGVVQNDRPHLLQDFDGAAPCFFRGTLRDLLVSAREAGLQTVYTVLTQDLSLVQREEIDSLLVAASPDAESAARSRLEQFKAVARKESPESLLALLDQLSDLRSLGLTAWPALIDIHPATRRLLADWAYRYSIWNLRRFSAAKREAIVICFLHAARAEMTDGIVEMQDKLITSIHNKPRKRHEDLLRGAPRPNDPFLFEPFVSCLAQSCCTCQPL